MPKPLLRTALFLAVAALFAACAAHAPDVEVGPYTISVIEKNVYHIQDYNQSNPAGETFDADGKLSHFNNCSDIYLLVGKDAALVIDLSNAVNWADDAAESLRAIVAERAGDKPVTVTFTHNHGDHTGMIPAMLEYPDAQFALPKTDFQRLAERFPEARRRFFDEGEVFDLGGLKVEAVAVPGHTAGSMVFYLQGHNLLFTGDAVGSGHGVWIFNADGFNNYVSAVPHLIAWLEDPAHGVDLDALQIYGGHYWQKDWLKLPKGRELGMEYLRDMKQLLDEMESGTAATEPSNLGRQGLDTYFRHGEAIVAWSAEQAERFRSAYAEPFVWRDEDIVFRRIDEHTWAGNGHLVYNESVYVLEGDDRALVIDAGSRMPRLDKAVAALTGKPATLALTHAHGDHVGGVGCFPEVWLDPADTALFGAGRRGYKGELNFLQDGQVIDLGGRQVEVLFTPGHTNGSVTFFDKERGYGFSGDAFGSTNLLLFGTFKQLVESTERTRKYMEDNQILKLYPGHYSGNNPETITRIVGENTMARELLSGRRKGIVDEQRTNGMNRYVRDYGTYIRYNDPQAFN